MSEESPVEYEIGEIAEFDSVYYQLESAIASTAEAAHGKEGLTATVLQDHLGNLCALQYALIAGINKPDVSE